MSEITEKVDALCSNAESLKQCLTDLVTMVRTQAEAIASLENTNKELIRQHDEEIEQLTLKLSEKDKELNEVTVENTTLHSSIAHLRKRINHCEGQLRKQCESVVSLQKTNSGLLKHQGENSQLKLQLIKKNNELCDVLTSNQMLISKVKSQEEDIAINGMCNTNLLSITDVYNKDKELEEREGEIQQLTMEHYELLKLTETRQKLRDETNKYDELLKSSNKPGVKATNDISDQSTEESESMSSSDEDSKFEEDEVIEDTNKKKLMDENPSSHTSGTSGQEGREAIKRKRKNDGGPVSKIAGPGN